ncbi:MAG: LysR family transcriptional regulator [Clostridiales bacterium]|nr:MAG: LysR family transcriptional regulator [Clostridiales bacterium]
MNIQYLKYAVEVARIGSISRAAEELYIAQPNLSRAIKELEKDLGITIFDRNSKGMTLTHDGERLIEYGKAILRQINEVEKRVQGAGEREKKSFSISVPRASYISSAFAEFSKCLEKEGNFEIFL